MSTWLVNLNDLVPLITLVAAVSTLILAIAAFLQIKRSKEQILEQEKTRSADLILKSFTIVEEVKFEKDEDYDIHRKVSFSKWDDASSMLAIKMTRQFEKISYITMKGFVDMDAMIDLHGSMIAEYWDVYKDFIYFMRGKHLDGDSKIKERYKFRKYFELFAIECKKYTDV